MLNEKQIIENDIESQEKLNEKQISVIFMRHGESSYQDAQNILKGGKPRDKSLLPDLSPKGIENINNKAAELAKKFEKEKDLVVIWTSPELRAIGAGQILEDNFIREGVDVIRNSEISSLSEAHTTPEGKLKLAPQRTHKYFDLSRLSEEQVNGIKEAKAAMEDPDMPFGETWRNYAGKEKFEDIEGVESSKKRFNRVINGLFMLKKIMKPEDPNKNLRFVCVVHEDLPNELLEHAFDKGLINHKGLGNGESVELTIKSESDKDIVTAKHQEEQKELIFDRKKRGFIYS